MPSVFLSYAHEDGEFATNLAAELTGRGADVWIDAKDIHVGDSISEKIELALQAADYVCLALSERSVTRPWVQREYRAALMLQTTYGRPALLPLIVDDIDVPVFLKDIRYADFRNNFLHSIDLLAAAIGLPSRVAPFVQLFRLVGSDENSARVHIECSLVQQDMIALCTIWNILVAAAQQLDEELDHYAHAVTVMTAASSSTLDSTDKSLHLLALPELQLHEAMNTLSLSRYSFNYGLQFNGLSELIVALYKFRRSVETRRLYLVPSAITWTRHWENLPDARIDYGRFFRNSGNHGLVKPTA